MSGKKVVVFSLLGLVIFFVIMLIGTYGFAQWLTPMLRKGAPVHQRASEDVLRPLHRSGNQQN